MRSLFENKYVLMWSGMCGHFIRHVNHYLASKGLPALTYGVNGSLYLEVRLQQVQVSHSGSLSHDFSVCMMAYCSCLTPACCAGQEAQAVTETTARPVEPVEPAEIEQEQASVERPAPQLHLAPQAELQQQAGSKIQEAEEATEPVADSTAGTATFSSGSGGGRYHSVPPSSLWGPSGGVATFSAGAVETEAAAQPASGVDNIADADSADAFEQPAEQLEVDHVGPSSAAFAGGNEDEEAAVRPGSHGMQDPASGAAGEQLPSSATLSPDTAVAEAVPADASSYHATPPVHDEWEAETAPDDWTVKEDQRALTTEMDVEHQPGTGDTHCKCTRVLAVSITQAEETATNACRMLLAVLCIQLFCKVCV